MPAEFRSKENFREGDAWLGGQLTENIPTLTSATPTAGSTDGGTSVAIVGTGFNSSTVVTVGSQPPRSIVVNSATSITIVTEADEAGVQKIVVSNSEGAAVDEIAFTFVEAPTVSDIDPVEGSADGGDVVTITGTGFVAPVTVEFGDAEAITATVVSATEITVTTPAADAGDVSVTVTTPGGAVTVEDGFTFQV